MKSILWASSLLAGFALTLPAANIRSFTGRTDWTNSVQAISRQIVTESFGGVVGAGDSTVVSQFTRNGVTFTPRTGTQLVISDRNAPGYDFGAPGSLSFQLGFPSTLDVTFASQVFDVGFDAGAFPAMSETTDLQILVNTTDGRAMFSYARLGGRTNGFAGFISDQRILSLTITGGPADPALTNFSMTGVPEPGTFALAGIVLAGAVLLRMRFARG